MPSQCRRLGDAVPSPGIRFGALVFAVSLGLGLVPAMAGAAPPASSPASDPDVVEGSYIVTLQPGNDPKQESGRLAQQHGGQARHVYEHALAGFSFEGSEQAAASLARNPKVRTVVADRKVAVAAQIVPTGVKRIDGPLGGTFSGADAVDVDVAIIDTGIDLAHPDLNVVGGKNCSKGPSYNDGNGHGTHVAGTVAAKDDLAGVLGVAPGARLWAVRVLDNSGSGSWSSVICGVDFVTANASKIKVANMSLGGTGSQGHCTDGGLRQAICKSVAAGVTYAVAAGNSAADVKGYVPASYPDVITVSALADFDGLPGGLGSPTCRSDVDDTFANFSNYGAGVDLIAPGVCVLSTWKGGGYNTISGTSMASPHVAGAAALYLSNNPGKSPDQVLSALQAAGNLEWNNVDDPDGIKEKLLNVKSLVGETILDPGANAAPVAGFTPSCTELTCDFTDTSTDADGTIASRQWSFGDGSGSTALNPVHTYAGSGTYTVTLTVTDDKGATGTKSDTVSVSAPATGGFTLSASGYKVKGLQKADLTWSGATTNVDIWRDGVKRITNSPNDGVETDHIDARGGGSYVYKICETGADTCSDTVTVTF